MQNEQANATCGGGASILTPLGMSEDAHAEGLYSVKCTGPLDAFRDRYLALHERLSRTGFAGIIDRLINGRWLRKELNAIPMELKWADTFKNVVCTQGKNPALDAFLSGSGYTANVYIGLMRLTGAVSVNDTMASHGGWLEAGVINQPTYTGPRKTPSWGVASAGAKATSAMSFVITGTGNVDGCFLVLGTGALSTIDNTAGFLYSVGAFTSGVQAVTPGSTLSVTYTASL